MGDTIIVGALVCLEGTFFVSESATLFDEFEALVRGAKARGYHIVGSVSNSFDEAEYIKNVSASEDILSLIEEGVNRETEDAP